MEKIPSSWTWAPVSDRSGTRSFPRSQKTKGFPSTSSLRMCTGITSKGCHFLVLYTKTRKRGYSTRGFFSVERGGKKPPLSVCADKWTRQLFRLSGAKSKRSHTGLLTEAFTTDLCFRYPTARP